MVDLEHVCRLFGRNTSMRPGMMSRYLMAEFCEPVCSVKAWCAEEQEQKYPARPRCCHPRGQFPIKRHTVIPARGRWARRPGRRQLARHALQPENLGTTATLSPELWRNTQDLTEPRQPRFPLNRGVTRKISQNHDSHAFP